jgi:hypothetical protein
MKATILLFPVLTALEYGSDGLRLAVVKHAPWSSKLYDQSCSFSGFYDKAENARFWPTGEGQTICTIIAIIKRAIETPISIFSPVFVMMFSPYWIV